VRTREEPLTRRERAELEGYVSWTTYAGRAALFVVAIAIVGAVSWRVQQWLAPAAALPRVLWLLPAAVAGLFLYRRSRRWTGGRELRDAIRRDLESNAALVHHVSVRDAVVFEEREDEGPVVFVLDDDGESLAFVGQDLARHVARGFPWRELELRESASSRRFLGVKRLGEPFSPLRRETAAVARGVPAARPRLGAVVAAAGRSVRGAAPDRLRRGRAGPVSLAGCSKEDAWLWWRFCEESTSAVTGDSVPPRSRGSSDTSTPSTSARLARS
jgi:hypothetical protein